MVRHIALALIVMPTLLLGCVEEHLEITLHADGSGRVAAKLFLATA